MNREQSHTDDFIKNLINNKHGFSAPKNYFNSIENKLMCNIIKDKLPKDHSFKTPNNYFDKIEETLLLKIEPSKKETKIISLRKRLLQIIPTAAAASVLFFIGLNYFSTSENYTFETISTDDLEIWVDENYSSSKFLEFIDSDFTDSNIIENETSLKDEDILDYFNTIDNSNLLTEIDS